ncbi:a0df17c7-e432-4ff5-824d-b0329de526c6 [Sclerotinia trifoliorum]|uniref:A0df17c7-e432-4ff5-824d-b0329de526c6 n=1 Tax=Sclerotinia trifoliorum TaxID=28548 RepID=A0A8H2ZL26_9HELO|nr:a0df17c7-e432-4ff5-824d-b0329de526c6 [Sclerotinia trifoliorum]
MMHQAHLQCSLCGYGCGEIQWTALFCAVLRTQDEDMVLTHPKYTSPSISFRLITFPYTSSKNSNHREIKVYCQRRILGSFNCFLVHHVCLQTLQDILKMDIPPKVLFAFCQALTEDWIRKDGASRYKSQSLANFDVSTPMFKILPPSENNPNLNHESKIDKLPLEIIWMILHYLDSKSRFSYFISNRFALSSSTQYSPWQLLLSYTNSILKQSITIQDMVIFAHRIFDDNDYIALDGLMSWIRILNHLASILKARYPLYSSSFWIPPKPIDNLPQKQHFPLGPRQITTHIPNVLTGFKVYLISIHGQKYVSGLEGIPSSTQISIGVCHGISYHIYFRTNQISSLGFVVDPLGIRSLKFGESGWSSEVPSTLNWFEGISINNDSNNQLVVFTDALKFRQIYWQYNSNTSLSFPETIIMKPFQMGVLSSEYYINRGNVRMSSYGTHEVPTESVFFDEDVFAISVRLQDGVGVTGVCVHSTTRLQTIGKPNDESSIYFQIQPYKEKIDKIWVWNFPGLYLTIHTTLGRSQYFGATGGPESTDTYKSFQPSQGQFIRGCYFWFYALAIECFGIVY